MENMKRTKQEIKKDQTTLSMDGGAYPWGLRITLEGSSLEKLGKDASDFEVGKSYFITAKAECQRISIEDDGKKDATVSLQVTELSVESSADAAIKDFDDAFGKD